MRRYVALNSTVQTAHNYFLLPRFNSTKNPKKSLVKEVVNNLVGYLPVSIKEFLLLYRFCRILLEPHTLQQ